MFYVPHCYKKHYNSDTLTVLRRVGFVENNLLKRLEQTREMMIQSGMKNGLQNPKTIRLSKRLDELMNQYDEEACHSQYGSNSSIKYLQ